MLLLERVERFRELYHGTLDFLLEVVVRSDSWVVSFISLTLTLFFYGSFLLEEVMRASTKGHCISLDKSFLDYFLNIDTPDYLTLFSLPICVLRFEQDFLGELVSIMYYRVSKALVTPTEFITYINTRLFIINFVGKFYGAINLQMSNI